MAIISLFLGGGSGLPSGGNTGQVPKRKADGTVEWADDITADPGAVTWPGITGTAAQQRTATDESIHKAVIGEIHAITSKTTPVANDEILLEDSAASFAKKRATLDSLPVSSATSTALSAKADATALAGYVATTTQIITATGSGLSGGDALDGDVTLIHYIPDITTGTVVDPAADYLVIYDNSEGANRKVLVEDFTFDTVDSTAIHTDASGEIAGLSAKASPIGADLLIIEDSADTNAKKKITISTLPTGADADAVHVDVDSEIYGITEKSTLTGNDLFIIEDSEDSYNKKKAKLTNITGSIPIDAYSPEAQDPDAGTGNATTDTAAIKACFTANNRVKFMKGKTYYINDEIDTTGANFIVEVEEGATIFGVMATGSMFTAQSGMTFRGLGNKYKCIIHGDRNNDSGKSVSKGAGYFDLFLAQTKTNITIENLTLKEFWFGGTHAVMFLEACSATIRNCFFDGGINIALWGTSGAYIFEDVIFDGTGDSVAAQELDFIGGSGDSVTIRNAEFYNCTRMALECGSTKFSLDGFIYDGDLTNTTYYPFSFPLPATEATNSILVQNGTFRNWKMPIEIGGGRQIYRNIHFFGNDNTEGTTCAAAFSVNNITGQGTVATIENCSMVNNYHEFLTGSGSGSSAIRSLHVLGCTVIDGTGIDFGEVGLCGDVLIENNDFYANVDLTGIALNGYCRLSGYGLVVRNNKFVFGANYAPYNAIKYMTPTVGTWAGSTSYTYGNAVINGDKIYIALTGGVSASSGGPTGTGSGITDNECVWNYFAPAAYANSEYARFEHNIFVLAVTSYPKAVSFVSAGDNSTFLYNVANNAVLTSASSLLDLDSATGVTFQNDLSFVDTELTGVTTFDQIQVNTEELTYGATYTFDVQAHNDACFMECTGNVAFTLSNLPSGETASKQISLYSSDTSTHTCTFTNGTLSPTSDTLTIPAAGSTLTVYIDYDGTTAFVSAHSDPSMLRIPSATAGDIIVVASNKSLESSGVTYGTSANNLLQLDSGGDLPAVDGSALTGLSSLQIADVQRYVNDTYPTVDGDLGRTLVLDKATAFTVTVHSTAAAGFYCNWINIGVGQVTFAAGGTGTMLKAATKTSMQYGFGGIYVVSNAGTAPQVALGGDITA